MQQGGVCDELSAEGFVRNSLWYNAKYNDALYVRLAWESATDVERLKVLDEECTALKSPMEIRSASLKLGVRLLKIFERKINAEELFVLTKNGGGHYSIIYGAVAAMMGISLRETLLSFYYNSLVCMVTNAVKLIPLGQLSGQDLIFRLEEELEELVDETIALNPEVRGVCAVAFDIKAMQHERLYSRLYMS